MPDEDRKSEERRPLLGRIRRSLQLNPGRLRRLDRWAEGFGFALLLALILRQGYQLPPWPTSPWP